MANKAIIATILACDASEPYKILSLPPNSSLSSVRRRYKTLALSLHPDKLSGEAAEEAFKRVAAAFRLLTDGDKNNGGDMVTGTFWTACDACRLLHEFDRRYVGYRLVCPRCRKSFLATEVPGPVDVDQDEGRHGNTTSTKVNKPSSSISQMKSTEKKRKQSEPGTSTKSLKPKKKPEKTLAELQLEITNKMKKLKEKENFKKTKQEFVEEEEESEEEMALRRTKPKESNLGLMAVEDSDFYNFDKDRDERSFKKGQIWAIYDDDDGMPRHYGLIENVHLNSRSFMIRLFWLDLDLHNQEKKSKISCGKFKSGRIVDLNSVNLFSHSIWFERAAKELYRIYPKKGSVWALYKTSNESRREYDVVLILTSFSDKFGSSFVHLEKIEGYKTLFKKRGLGGEGVRFVEREEEIRVFSHQIPSRRLAGEDSVSGLEGLECWELDPASLPPQLLSIGWEKEKISN